MKISTVYGMLIIDGQSDLVLTKNFAAIEIQPGVPYLVVRNFNIYSVLTQKIKSSIVAFRFIWSK